MRAIEKEAIQNKRCRRAGELLAQVGAGAGAVGLREGLLTGIRIRFRTEQEPSVLLVIRAWDERGKHISFIGAADVLDTVLAWGARRTAGTMKWREDVPWSERKGNGTSA